MGGGFGGFMAAGGPVQPSRAYIVGEQGPELFVPGSAGRIVPNKEIQGRGGVTVNQNFSMSGIDIGSQETVRRIFRQAAAQMRSGAADMLTFAGASGDQTTKNERRAY
jgi:hypothetical protein